MEISYSQEQLARVLWVSIVIINRWNNGKSEPRQIALNTFEHFCMSHNVNIEEE